MGCVVDGKTYKSSGQTQTLPDSSENTDIEMNAEKTKYSNTPPNTLDQSAVLTVYSWQ